jgi:hypothetical protein
MGVSQEEIAAVLDLSNDQVKRVVEDILRKKKTTDYLRLPALRMSGDLAHGDPE